MAIANLRPKLLEVETTLQHSVKCIDVALFILERAISEMRGQP
jgi:hypothetical protein